ncbi:MAG: energy transducer TonB [Cephaloticoccus sp.]|nr:energy transducer TonB [Cephaloticoccus sp.]
MNKIKMLVSASIVSAIISSSAFAVGVSPSSKVTKVTHPVKVVAPTDLPRKYLGETIEVSLLVDEAGLPSNIRMESHYDSQLTKSVVSAIAQWRFAPAEQDGRVIAKRVMLPIEFVVKS